MILNLYDYKQEISKIVETTTKEMKIDKQLKEIEDFQSSIKLDYSQCKDTDFYIPHLVVEIDEGMEVY